jgi:hypothetical protein
LGCLSNVGLKQCFEHTENQKADTCGLCERQDVCLPSWRGFFVSEIVGYIFADQVLISQNIDAIDFID